MAKTAVVKARIEPELKKVVDAIFKELGLSTTDAISLFYNKVRLTRGIPFDLKVSLEKERQRPLFNEFIVNTDRLESEDLDSLCKKLDS